MYLRISITFKNIKRNDQGLKAGPASFSLFCLPPNLTCKFYHFTI